jgi:hypothetical protein
MLTYSLAIATFFIAEFVSNVLTLPIHALDKWLQWAGKSAEEWQAHGVDNPGERLRAVSVACGLLSTMVTRLIAVWVAGRVFEWRGTVMPLGFIVAAGALIFVNDVVRIRRFLGNSGIWTELGYAAGGILGLTLYVYH